MVRRLFQRLGQRVEGVAGEPADFVDVVDFVLALHRSEGNLVAEVADVVDVRVGRSVDLDEIKEAAFIDGDAVRAGVIWPLLRVFVQAVHSLRQQACGRRLTGTAWTAEQVGVPNAPRLERVAKRAGD